MEIKQLIKDSTSVLKKHGIDNAEIDIQLLLSHCLGMSRTELYLHGNTIPDPGLVSQFMQLLLRRADREPVAYILSEREFFSRSFFVSPDVLIPRPETEFLLEKVIEEASGTDLVIDRCLDLCCGSGIIAVILALELDIDVLAVDCSGPAIEVTSRNIQTHGVQKRVTTCVSDLFSVLEPDRHLFPLIVSNPPYVRKKDIAELLEPEVARFEPELALDGGDDGLRCIERISNDILSYLSPGGMFFMEFGSDQGEAVAKIFSSVKADGRYFSSVEIFKDYSGRDRVLFAKANFY